jgi:hypothetical protein
MTNLENAAAASTLVAELVELDWHSRTARIASATRAELDVAARALPAPAPRTGRVEPLVELARDIHAARIARPRR